MTPEEFYKKVKNKYDFLSRSKAEENLAPYCYANKILKHRTKNDQDVIAEKILNQNIDDFKQLPAEKMKKIKWGEQIIKRVFKRRRR